MSLFSRFVRGAPAKPGPVVSPHAAEARHWNEIAARVRSGERLFWLSHPEVARLHNQKAKLDGFPWREWVVRQLGGPAATALELGCGQAIYIEDLVSSGVAKTGVGIDLDESRFRTVRSDVLELRAADINRIQLDENRYDLIYSLQSFHHFECLEHVMEQVNRALTPRGYFVLDEFVGPSRFQWTDLQLSITANLLALLPSAFRQYANGSEKRVEGRSTPEQVINVCPSEAIRSDEIPSLFHKYFEVVHDKKLGGTIQHLLYSGIIQNFPDHVPEVDRIIDSIEAIETHMVAGGVLPSDFVVLVGKKRL